MAHLTGRAIKTVVNNLEVVSDDSSQVLAFARDEDGTIRIIVRPAYESNWNIPAQFVISKGDASLLSYVFNGTDAQYVVEKVKSIPATTFKTENPNPTPDPNRPDCTQLDIERAKAENLKEERELLRLSLIRDHSLNKHISADVEGCEACATKFVSGTSLNDFDPNDPSTLPLMATDAPDEELPF